MFIRNYIYLVSFQKMRTKKKLQMEYLSSIVNKLIILFDEELSFIEIDKYLLV